MIGSLLSGGNGMAKPSRGQVCAQAKQAVRQIERQFGEQAPSKAEAAKLVADLCSRKPDWVPGGAPDER